MHELGLALEVIDAASSAAKGARVQRVVVEVGRLAAVLPDALRFAFELAVEESPLAGAVLEIREVPGRARCRACAGEVLLEKPFGRCACGGSDLEWLSGEELKIVQVEVV